METASNTYLCNPTSGTIYLNHAIHQRGSLIALASVYGVCSTTKVGTSVGSNPMVGVRVDCVITTVGSIGGGEATRVGVLGGTRIEAICVLVAGAGVGGGGLI